MRPTEQIEEDEEIICVWCNNEGAPDGDGEMHPCCWCGSEG